MLQNLIITINVKYSINVMKTTMQRIRKNLIFKKIKIKITNNFIANKKTLNAKAFKENENYI